ncbi:MAG: hypothetical protein R3B48_17560 [Kofleriaceae bacterium]
MRVVQVLFLLLGLAGTADAEEVLVRRPDASWREIFRGPFGVSQLFAMPTANVVGAYQLRLYGDASLLSERDVLSTSSVAALGFGDLAQLEYRQSAAISHRSRELFGLPSLGVQFEVPLRERRYVPRFGLALRFGLPHEDVDRPNLSFDERATDLYLVTSLVLSRVELHVGTRISAASIEPTSADGGQAVKETLILPAVGLGWGISAHTSILVEASMIPRFELPTDADAGAIGADPYGRAGVRWFALPWLTLDASVGYHVEIERRDRAPNTSGSALVDWDIRLGGELAIPWGAVVCRSVGVFCS